MKSKLCPWCGKVWTMEDNEVLIQCTCEMLPIIEVEEVNE